MPTSLNDGPNEIPGQGSGGRSTNRGSPPEHPGDQSGHTRLPEMKRRKPFFLTAQPSPVAGNVLTELRR